MGTTPTSPGTTPSTNTDANTTADADSETETAAALKPATVYDECIVSNSRICNNCFLRIKTIEPAPDDDYWLEHGIRTSNGHSTDWLRELVCDKTLGPTEDGVKTYPGADIDASGEVIRVGTNSGVIACADCGRLNGRADTEARSIGEMVTATGRIADRLAEQDVAFDREVLFDRMRALKTTPKLAAKDFEIFAQAVAAAVADTDTDPETPPETPSDE